jgi:ATP-binding protein involved in chromosome partitioning
MAPLFIKHERNEVKMSDETGCSAETSCGTCESSGTCDSATQQLHMQQKLSQRLDLIKHRIVVMSGKGGVGKTTVAVNLAVTLAASGKAVGILDADVHGPNIPKMLGLNGRHATGGESGLIPIVSPQNVKVMSMAFMLPNDDTPVVWRGPVKHAVFNQFLSEVDWGELDYLIVDLPPGTGDEPLSIAQLLGQPLWAIVVTTPQDVALLDSRKSVVFASTLEMNMLGIVENMSGLACPHCGKPIDLFKTGGGQRSSRELRVPFLGAIPIDPAVVQGGDEGLPISVISPDSVIAKAFQSLAEEVESVVGRERAERSAIG